MKNFFKGIIAGIGGVAPGLSGSVLLIVLGLYQKTITAISTLFKNFKQNLKFLVPLFLGVGVGVLIFGKIVDFLLTNFEMYTRFAFLGLVLGTIPLFYKEVRKEGFGNKYYIYIVLAAAAGLFLFTFNKNLFPTVTEPNLLQSVFLGVAVAGSSIVPGVDSAVILSGLGLYELYVGSIADLKFSVLIPAGFGLVIGALVISFIINQLLKRFYTATFSIIFGLFLSIIPRVLNESCAVGPNFKTFLSFFIMLCGIAVSYFFENLEQNIERIKSFSQRRKERTGKKAAE